MNKNNKSFQKLQIVKCWREKYFRLLCHENNEDDEENNQDAENLNHQPSIGRDALKIFD